MFQYDFIKRAMLAGFFISVTIPLIGTVVVNRKTSTIGDALSHTSLAGIFLGLIFSINPIIGGVIAAIIAAFSIEFFRKRFPQNGDMATAIITSLGIGLASIFSEFIPGSQNFESFLFGSIVAVTKADLIIIGVTSILVLIAYYFLYYGLLAISIDETGARLSGVNTSLSDNVFTLILALTIAISARIVGVLIVSSLMILPVATGMIVGKNYRQTLAFSLVFGLVYFFIGLVIASYFYIKPGGSVILVSVAGLVLAILIKSLIRKRQNA